MLRLNGEQLFIWAAIDVDSREVLAVDASWQRSAMNAEHVLKKTLETCLNKPIIQLIEAHGVGRRLKTLG